MCLVARSAAFGRDEALFVVDTRESEKDLARLPHRELREHSVNSF